MQLTLELEPHRRIQALVYSIAICPPQAVIGLIRKLKEELNLSVGWYGSKNSEAHNTFNVFEANCDELNFIETFVELFCKQITPVELRFNRISYYEGSNALIILPDDSTKKILVPIMQKFKKGFPRAARFSTDPHISIGRGLSNEQIEIAMQLFQNCTIDIQFLWDNLALRKLNWEKKQYQVDKRFLFS